MILSAPGPDSECHPDARCSQAASWCTARWPAHFSVNRHCASVPWLQLVPIDMGSCLELMPVGMGSG